MRKNVSFFLIAVTVWGMGCVQCAVSHAQMPECSSQLSPVSEKKPDNPDVESEENEPKPGSEEFMKSLGITQIWADIGYRGSYRLQVDYTGQKYRIIGDYWKLIEKGTEEDVLKKWEALCETTPETKGVAVLMVHGITRSSWCFNNMKKQIQDHGWNAYVFDYPSTYVPIEQCAEYLARAIDSLKTADEVHIIAHSMGGLVTRRYFQVRPEKHGLSRVIMLGTPNTGAELANLFGNWYLYRKIMGPAGQQLAVNPEGLIKTLPSPACEFGLVAGGRGPETNGYNLLLQGDDDFTVRVDSVFLEGAADFYRLPCVHLQLMKNKRVIENCIQFLQSGAFQESSTDEWLAITERRKALVQESEPQESEPKSLLAEPVEAN